MSEEGNKKSKKDGWKCERITIAFGSCGIGGHGGDE
jgi:hypothetical protein